MDLTDWSGNIKPQIAKRKLTSIQYRKYVLNVAYTFMKLIIFCTSLVAITHMLLDDVIGTQVEQDEQTDLTNESSTSYCSNYFL